MKITYFTIENCEYEMVAGYPAIIAPEGIDEEVLKRNNFVQLIDGRWCHFMDDAEISYYNEKSRYYNDTEDTKIIEFSMQQLTGTNHSNRFITDLFFIIVLLLGGLCILVDIIAGISIVLSVFLIFWIIHTSDRFLEESDVKHLFFICITLSIILLYRFSCVTDTCKHSFCDGGEKHEKENCEDECFHEFQKILIMGSQHIYYWE